MQPLPLQLPAHMKNNLSLLVKEGSLSIEKFSSWRARQRQSKIPCVVLAVTWSFIFGHGRGGALCVLHVSVAEKMVPQWATLLSKGGGDLKIPEDGCSLLG